MNYKKQSSIDWLAKQLYSGRELSTIIQQAKEMHKEEIRTAFIKGDLFSVDYFGSGIDEDEQYYNETFIGEK